MTRPEAQKASRPRSPEKGAALITAMLTSTLLLGLGLTLLLTSMMQSTTTASMTSEMQAYYAADAGIEAALNVLRGNVAPDNSIAGTKMSLTNAVNTATANLASDKSTVSTLSAWLQYNGASVPIGPGLSYGVTVTDPGPDDSNGPSRVVITSTGHGPNGSTKIMGMIVARSSLSSFNIGAPPSVITIRGADDGAGGTISAGPSNAHTLDGLDNAGSGVTLPIFGVTNTADQASANTAAGSGTVVGPPSALLSISSLPSWLQTADNARAMESALMASAQASGRYFDNSSGFPNDAGSTNSPKFTYFAGNATIGPGFTGAGLLVVTGNLTLKGNFSWDGLIVVLGAGSLQRQGGGNGQIEGAIIVANFGPTGQFNPPSFDTSGGGNSTIQYDSNWVSKGFGTIPPQPPLMLGVAEE